MQANKKLLDKLFWVTLLTTLFLFFSSEILFQASISWYYTVNFTWSEYQEIYPKFYFIAFFLFKITPWFILPLLLFLQVTLWRKDKAVFNSIHNQLANKRIFTCLSLLIVLLLIIIHNQHQGHLYITISFIIFTFLVIYFIYNFDNDFNTINWVTLLVLGNILVRLGYLHYSGFYQPIEDSLARIAEVYTWEKNSFRGIPGGMIWLPSYFWLVFGLSKLFFVSYEVGGIILSILSNIGIVYYGYKLFKTIFNKHIAIISIYLYSIIPLFVRFSCLQMTEIPFLFFCVFALYQLIKYENTHKQSSLFLGIFAINVLNLIRFDGWLITPLLILIALFKKRKNGELLKILMLSSITILFAIFYSLAIYGDPIYGITASDIEVSNNHTNDLTTSFYNFKTYMLGNWSFPVYFFYLSISSTLFFLFSWKQNSLRLNLLAISILCLFGFKVYKVLTMTLEPFWRYFTVDLFMMIPFSLHFFRRVQQKYLFLGILFLFTGWSYKEINLQITNNQTLNPSFFNSIHYYNSLSDKNDKVIFSFKDETMGADMFWLGKSNFLLDSKQQNHFLYQTVFFKSPNPGEVFTVENILYRLENKKFNWLITDKNNITDSLFNSESYAKYLKTTSYKDTVIGEFRLIHYHDK